MSITNNELHIAILEQLYKNPELIQRNLPGFFSFKNIHIGISDVKYGGKSIKDFVYHFDLFSTAAILYHSR